MTKGKNESTVKTKIIYAIAVCLVLFLGITLVSQIGDARFVFDDLTGQHYELKDRLSKKAEKSPDRSDYPNDAAYTNYRSLSFGKIKDDYIYRGVAPYREDGRAPYICNNLKNDNIEYVVTLSDTQETINNMLSDPAYDNNYFLQSVKDGTIIDDVAYYDYLIDFSNLQHIQILVKSLKNLSESNGKVYVHCHSGRDRTGGYCVMLGCLVDATYEDIVKDYMLSYELLSYITIQDYPDKYYLAKEKGVDTFLHQITKTDSNVDLSTIDLKESAVNLLISNGMNQSEIDSLLNKICK